MIHTSILFCCSTAAYSELTCETKWGGGEETVTLTVYDRRALTFSKNICQGGTPPRPQKPYLSLVCILLLMGKTLTDRDSVKMSPLEENGICYISLRSLVLE